MADEPATLSERELEVLKLVATGASNQEIARALVISPNTVKVHLRNIFEKLGVQSRTEATMEAVRRGWVGVGSLGDGSPGGGSLGVGSLTPSVDAGPASAPDGLVFPEPTPAPLARWKHVYMLVAALLISLAALVPTLASFARGGGATSLFTDAGKSGTRAEIRAPLLRWNQNAALPAPRSRLALVAGDQRLYVIGGETRAGVTGQVAVYDIAENRWLPAAEKPTPVSNVGAVLIGDRIYVPGGTLLDGQVSASLEVLNVRSGEWESGASLPEPRAAYALATVSDRLYLFGGWDGAAYRRDVFVYDPAADSWSEATPLPTERALAGAGVLDGVIYIAGGFDGAHNLADVEAYDPQLEGSAAGPWSSRAPMSRPRAGHAVSALGARLYVLGGGAAEAYGEQYDASTGAWSRFESPVPGEWRGLGTAAHERSIYTIGGWAGDYLDVNAAYEAIIRVLLPFGTKGN
jgi:DNA-binding CsgD family transcriptional regulator/N-acetylneuraminic acid mutarotase